MSKNAETVKMVTLIGSAVELDTRYTRVERTR